MKSLLLLIGSAISINAQTYVNYKITNFDSNGNGSMSFSVPTNTIFKAISGSMSLIQVTYPEWTNAVYYSVGPAGNYDGPGIILGPATIQIAGYYNSPAVLLGEFEAVNTTPAIQGFAVQPNGQTASISLQSSPDLINWTTATNGVYPATNAAAFYRMAFQVSP